MVLFLGARAGGLFGNENFYQLMKDYSLVSFDDKTDREKFEECYKVLNDQIFDEKSVGKIFIMALRALYYREDDEHLVSLIEAGMFDVIITTNIDDLLEEAALSRGLKAPQDYEVFTYSTQNIAKRMQSKPPKYCRIIKVFGDVKSHYKAVGKDFDLEQPLKDALVSQLQGDVLLVGYDPLWDKPMEQIFPETGGQLWYVNEEPPNTYLAQLLNKRDGRYLEAQWGSYARFWKILFDLTRYDLQRLEDTASRRPSFHAASLIEKKICVVYSRKNEIYMKRLLVHLKGLLHLRKGAKREDDLIIKWPVTRLASKSKKKHGEGIKEALASSKVAILLVSADFLKPDIRDHELPALVQAAKERNIEIYSVILDFGHVKDPLLTQSRAMNAPEEPLENMNPYEQEVVWHDLTDRICQLLMKRK